MIIKSKKTGELHSITDLVWLEMKASGDYVNFSVINRQSQPEVKPPMLPLPSVKEFIDKRKELEEAKKPKKRKPTNK